LKQTSGGGSETRLVRANGVLHGDRGSTDSKEREEETSYGDEPIKVKKAEQNLGRPKKGSLLVERRGRLLRWKKSLIITSGTIFFAFGNPGVRPPHLKTDDEKKDLGEVKRGRDGLRR